MDAARAHIREALVIAREMKDRSLQSDAYNGLGTMEVVPRPDRRAARAHFEKALALAREAGDRRARGPHTRQPGNSHTSTLGSMDEARSHDEAALAVAREIGNRRLEGNILCNLGLLHQVQRKVRRGSRTTRGGAGRGPRHRGMHA